MLCKDALVGTVQAVGIARNRNEADEFNTDYGIKGVVGCRGNKVLASNENDVDAAKVDVCGSKIQISEEAELNCSPCAKTFKIRRIGEASVNFNTIQTDANPDDTMQIIPRARQLTMGDKTWFQIAAAKK